eukprot:12791710-Alexandrium_andersonii.AAC.1
MPPTIAKGVTDVALSGLLKQGELGTLLLGHAEHYREGMGDVAIGGLPQQDPANFLSHAAQYRD